MTIEEICEKRGYELARKIDDNIALVFKPRPGWMPHWVWARLIRIVSELVYVKDY